MWARTPCKKALGQPDWGIKMCHSVQCQVQMLATGVPGCFWLNGKEGSSFINVGSAFSLPLFFFSFLFIPLSPPTLLILH